MRLCTQHQADANIPLAKPGPESATDVSPLEPKHVADDSIAAASSLTGHFPSRDDTRVESSTESAESLLVHNIDLEMAYLASVPTPTHSVDIITEGSSLPGVQRTKNKKPTSEPYSLIYTPSHSLRKFKGTREKGKLHFFLMEILSSKWLSELEMEDPAFFPQLPFDEYSFDETNFQSLSSESYSSYPNIEQKISQNDVSCNNIEAYRQVEEEEELKRPMKQLKTNNWSFSMNQNIPPKVSSSSSHIISFNNSDSPPPVSQQHYGLDSDVKPSFNEVSKRAVGSLTRTPLHAQDHVIAERKRREKLSQRFISLSTLIPGLKKTDKASILGDAIKYMKQLQEKVATLEEQAAKKMVESVILVKKTQIYADDETSSSDENFDTQSNKPFPEIEARVSDKDVLLTKVEKLHLSVVNTNVLPFGQATLDITIVTQMEAEFSMTGKDLVKNLRLALLKFM
ncbi:hypothetical protein V6N13_111407 [Hibiscus sabdariffa]